MRVLLSRDTTSIVVAPLSYHLVMTREQCVQCGFDSDVYDRADTISSQPIIHLLLRASIEGLPSDVLQQRPAADTWSIAEYIDHVREVAFGNRFAIETALNESGADLGEPPSPTVHRAVKSDRTPPIVRSLCGLHNSDQLPVEPTMAR